MGLWPAVRDGVVLVACRAGWGCGLQGGVGLWPAVRGGVVACSEGWGCGRYSDSGLVMCSVYEPRDLKMCNCFYESLS